MLAAAGSVLALGRVVSVVAIKARVREKEAYVAAVQHVDPAICRLLARQISTRLRTTFPVTLRGNRSVVIRHRAGTLK